MLPRRALRLGSLFETRGHQIRVVGGWVRDTLRGFTPKDLDFSTTALPDEIIALCDAHGLPYSDAGRKHGTIGVIYRGQMYEVTTLRVDIDTDGRHATVEFTDDWRADAARRDFTINAMSMTLTGRLYDYFDGYRDLRQQRLSFVGDPVLRIREDYLRILRYFRFKGWLNDEIDDTGIERAIRDNAEGLRQISVERIWSEMARILAGNNLRNVLFSMWVTDTTGQIGLDDVGTYEIQRTVDARALTTNPITLLATLTNRPMAQQWNMSNDETSLLRWLQVDRHIAKPFFHELKAIATTRGLGHAYATERAAMYGDPHPHQEIRTWTVPAFPVTGSDLLALGFSTGPEVGRVLELLRLRWQQSDYTLDRDTLLRGIDDQIV